VDNKFIKGAPLPASLGPCVDLYKEVQELRLAMQKEVDAVKARESEIKQHIIDNLSKSDDTGVAGKRYRAQIVTKATPAVSDWDKVWDFIRENDRTDLVQKRINDKAVKEIWEAGEEVPGVDKFNSVDVSVRKV